MFNPVSPNPPSAREAISGIVLAMVLCYVLYNIPDFLRGDFSLDYAVIRFLLVIGILVLGFAGYEARCGQRA